MILRALPFNLVVTNVPGPQLPLYLLGARMLDSYGLVPLIDYLCLGIVLFSYDGQLCWGFTCDWDLLPDLHDFVHDIEASFDDLQRAAGALPPAIEESAARRPRGATAAQTRARPAPEGANAGRASFAAVASTRTRKALTRVPARVLDLAAFDRVLTVSSRPFVADGRGAPYCWLHRCANPRTENTTMNRAVTIIRRAIPDRRRSLRARCPRRRRRAAVRVPRDLAARRPHRLRLHRSSELWPFFPIPSTTR